MLRRIITVIGMGLLALFMLALCMASSVDLFT